MSLDRRTLIKNLLILTPAGYAGVKYLPKSTPPLKNYKGFTLENKILIYPHLLNPRNFPNDKRRYVKPPDWNTFTNKTHFITLRSFRVENNKIVDFSRDLNIYTRIYQLGDIVWPNHQFLNAGNVPDLVEEFKRRALFLFDIWGYVPGSGPGTWTQFKLSPELSELFSSQLGDHWLGMDNGEQDGRYIGGYALQMYPSAAPRQYQYLNFQQHFEELTDDLGNKMSTLVSLSFGHYFLKTGLYTMIGAETAQALPNTQIFYSFIRGAGKQYGVPWFGNTSVYNRWGFKSFDSIGNDHGPTKGTSLSLMRRLIYSHILYNSVAVGFEAGWFYSKKLKDFSDTKPDENLLTPIGHIQRNAVNWIKDHGQPGVMYTPVALMLDFFAGWTFPRHLYSDDVYRVWGNLPYQAGDYWTDALLDIIYPGYQNSSYYHDESGFICPTPYGDVADCILSDAGEWILNQYPILVIAGELSGGTELQDKLENYVNDGGHLIITSANLSRFHDGITGIKSQQETIQIKSGQTIYFSGKQLVEEYSFNINPLSYPDQTHILARVKNNPLIVNQKAGKGQITVLACEYGISAEESVPPDAIKSEVDTPLRKPYPILLHVREFLNDVFNNQKLFSVNENLGFITCSKSNNEYLLGITNNTWNQQTINLTSHCGKILSISELPIGQKAKTSSGYLPDEFQHVDIGESGENVIAGGDIRIFSVKVISEHVEIMSEQVPVSISNKPYLPLRNIQKIKNEILFRPTFFEHFKGITLDWKYLHERESKILKQEYGWINRQGLKIIVDLTSGVDFYPELRLIDNLPEEYQSSMTKIEDVISKMPLIHATELILPLHRFSENNFTKEQTWNSFKNTFIRLCHFTGQYGITLHIRLALGRPPFSFLEAIDFIKKVNEKNLKLAPETSFMIARNQKVVGADELIGMWLVNGLEKDISGKYWNQNLRISSYEDKSAIKDMIDKLPQIPGVLDGIYKNHDEEYLDAQVLMNV